MGLGGDVGAKPHERSNRAKLHCLLRSCNPQVAFLTFPSKSQFSELISLALLTHTEQSWRGELPSIYLCCILPPTIVKASILAFTQCQLIDGQCMVDILYAESTVCGYAYKTSYHT